MEVEVLADGGGEVGRERGHVGDALRLGGDAGGRERGDEEQREEAEHDGGSGRRAVGSEPRRGGSQ